MSEKAMSLTPPHFLAMRKSRGAVCPQCGSQKTEMVGQFGRDYQENDQRVCLTCGHRYTFVHMRE